MRKMLATSVLVVVALTVTGCSSGSEEKSSADTQAEWMESASPEPTEPEPFDKDALKEEEFNQALETMPAGVKLDICEASAKNGVQGVKDYMTSEDYPFEVNDLNYDAKHFDAYSNKK